MCINVSAGCIHENKVCGEDNNKTQADKNFVLSFMLSKAKAVGIKFCYGEISNFKSASR